MATLTEIIAVAEEMVIDTEMDIHMVHLQKTHLNEKEIAQTQIYMAWKHFAIKNGGKYNPIPKFAHATEPRDLISFGIGYEKSLSTKEIIVDAWEEDTDIWTENGIEKSETIFIPKKEIRFENYMTRRGIHSQPRFKDLKTTCNLSKYKDFDYDEDDDPIENSLHDITEIEETPDLYQKCEDLTVTQSFVDQGTTHPFDELPMTHMDKTIFSEMCTNNGKSLIALQEKTWVDIQRPWHLRPETIKRLINTVNITGEEALRLSDAWTELNFDYPTVKRLIFGYIETTNDIENKKIIKHPGLRASKSIMTDYFETKVAQLPKLQREGEFTYMTFDHCRQKQLTIAENAIDWDNPKRPHIISIIRGIEMQAEIDFKAQTADQIRMTGFNEETNASHWIDEQWTNSDFGDDQIYNQTGLQTDNSAYLSPEELAGVRKDSVHGGRPLFTQAESLNSDWLMDNISKAEDFQDLNDLKRNMFWQRKIDPKTGKWEINPITKKWKWYPPAFNNFTQSQKSQFWENVKYRENQLCKKAVKNASNLTRGIASILRNFKSQQLPQMKALIATYSNGGTFKYNGKAYNLDKASYIDRKIIQNAFSKRIKEI